MRQDGRSASLTAPNAGMELDARLTSSWWDRLVDAESTVSVGARPGGQGQYRTETSCGAVTGALPREDDLGTDTALSIQQRLQRGR